MERRNFLSTAPVGSFASILTEPEEPSSAYHLIRVTRRAMATTFEIAIPYGTPHAIEAATDALDLIDQLEDQLSVYRATSEISQLNARAAQEFVVVESRLFALLRTASMIANETAGAFDICTGAITKAWGFYRRAGHVPDPVDRSNAMARCGSRHMILNDELSSVKFRVPGVEINLGAIGKGYALDRAAERLREGWHIESALLSVGGSSIYAMGHPPGEPEGWLVDVRHPWKPMEILGSVRLINRGFGTSAATEQHFVYNGRVLGHLIDPRTGWPAEGTASASVAAPTATEADALSTAFFVLGADAAQDFARSRIQLGGILLVEGEDKPRMFGTL